MIRWLRVSLPEALWIAMFGGFYVGALGLFYWAERYVGGPLIGDDGQSMRARSMSGYCVMVTIVYAIWRALIFHPRGRPGYAQWLAATPWTSQKPLPLGPVHLVPQDALLVGVVVLLTWLNGVEWALLMPQLFLAVYAGILGATFFTTNAWAWGYAVLFGVGLTVRLWHDIPASLAAALLTNVVAYFGLRQALGRFPWEESWLDVQFGQFHKKSSVPTSATVGWPYGRLAPKFPGSELGIAMHHALLLSALIGWAVYVGLALIPQAADRNQGSQVSLGCVLLMAPAARLLTYCMGYVPPISFLGRLATGRWIIPGYDQIAVAPLLAWLTGAALEAAHPLLDIDPLYARPAIIAIVMAICLGVGPTWKAWQLTGNHRIAVTTLRAETVKVG